MLLSVAVILFGVFGVLLCSKDRKQTPTSKKGASNRMNSKRSNKQTDPTKGDVNSKFYGLPTPTATTGTTGTTGTTERSNATTPVMQSTQRASKSECSDIEACRSNSPAASSVDPKKENSNLYRDQPKIAISVSCQDPKADNVFNSQTPKEAMWV